MNAVTLSTSAQKCGRCHKEMVCRREEVCEDWQGTAMTTVVVTAICLFCGISIVCTVPPLPLLPDGTPSKSVAEWL